MIPHEPPPPAPDVASQLPDLPGVKLAAARIADYTGALWPPERAAIARARERRAHEFSTGRHLARHAMAALGMEPTAVPRAEDRSPVWPSSIKGSITHAGDLAVVAVSRADLLTGLGLDLEQADRVTENLFPKLFTRAELDGLENGDPRLAGLLFSAKEAAYKAVNPRVGRYIGFREAEAQVSWEDRSLTLRYVGDHEPTRIMDRGVGHFCFFEQYVLTVFIIP